MRTLKSQFLLRIFNSYVVDSPQPANLSYLWNFGSLLAVCLIIQILTGAFLAMHYTPNVDNTSIFKNIIKCNISSFIWLAKLLA